MIDLAPQHLHEIRRLLAFYAPGCQAIAYGSRVRGTARETSDLDIALTGPADYDTLERLKDGFSISSIPIFIDVVLLSEVSDTFRQIILSTGEKIPPLELIERTPEE